METLVLERYIQDAEKAFERQEFTEGLRLLEEALTIEPNYGKAHNHMGWLYLFHIVDWEKAELHLKLALKYAPSYHPVYMHLSHLYFEKRRITDLVQLLETALKVGSVSKSFIFNEYGRLDEVNGKLRKAVRNYKLAVRWCFNDQEMNTYKDNIRRCRDKRWILWF